MTLSVKIINKIDNMVLDKNFNILIDDTISQIKEKLFVNTKEINYYPNFLKIEIFEKGQNGDLGIYKTIKSDNCLLYFYKEPTENNEIYISGIHDTLSKYKNYTENDLYTLMKADDTLLYDIYDDLVIDYIDLTLDDLVNLIKMVMYNFNSENQILSETENKILFDDISVYVNTIIEKNQKSIKKLEKEKYLSDFYKEMHVYDNSKFYEKKDNLPNVTYTALTFNIKSESYDSSIDGKIIKIENIFNILELSEKIPFIVFNNKPRTNPKIKVYNNLELPESVIKSWVLNEKKKIKKERYKKIKGLMMKYKINLVSTKIQNTFATVLIDENGLITIKLNFEEEDNQKGLTDIYIIVNEIGQELMNSINNLQGVFTKSKRFNNLEISLVSINSILETSIEIKMAKLRKIFTKYQGSSFFEAKDTKDNISMYYKKYGKRDDELNEILGITVNLKDNPYLLNSSMILIYGCYNLLQMKTIIDEICILSKLSEKLETNIFDDSDENIERVIRERRQNIKLLRDQGSKISAITCQKKRQPIIDNVTKITDTELVLNYKGNKYTCENNGKHKYPGLAGDIPCCFEHPNKGISSIIDTKILEIKVQPSNFKITVNENNHDGANPHFETFVIKVVSNYIENIDLSKSRYFYLDYNTNSDLPLVHIHNDQLVLQIEKDQEKNGASIWLPAVQLYQLVSKPKKNTCINIPDINNRDPSDINKPCLKHPDTVFGYNLKSFPCCFEKEPVVYNKNIKEINEKMHIYTTDKLLGYKRQGVLQPGLNTLLNEIIKEKTGSFLRWGVNQNELSFMNCIVEISDHFDSTYELKRYLTNYLSDNKNVFSKLNNGNISVKYNTMDNYINKINNETVIDYHDTLDLIQNALSCNILIIDIPYTETLSKTTYSYQDMKLECNVDITWDITKPFVFLIKKHNYFEIIVLNSATHWNIESQKMQILNKTPNVKFSFNYQKDKSAKESIVNFFVDFYKSTCIKENEFPEGYMYNEMYTFKYLLPRLKDNILGQIVNKLNKVLYLILKNGLVIPIKETGIIDNIPILPLYQYISSEKAKSSIKKMQENLVEFNKLIETKMEITGMITRDNMYVAVMTNFGQMIPIKNEKIYQMDIPILPIKYYNEDLDDPFVKNKSNESSNWTDIINNEKQKIKEIKKELGSLIHKDEQVKTMIININKNGSMDKFEKIKTIKNILKQLLNRETPEFFLDIISNDILNDNNENLLLNNLITDDIYDINKIITRPTESVLLNINELKRWMGQRPHTA